jgi:2-C-methyl-D-erythritol 4-phosphate cytidylyltransferase
MKHDVIIVAGGSGNRMMSAVPKQFVLLGGRPILMHTIQRFFHADSSARIIVVLPGSEIGTWKELCKKYNFQISHELTAGGETRFHSVQNGLKLVTEKSVVAVHDGARPFAGVSFIRTCFSEAEKSGNAVPAIPVNESIRRLVGDQSSVTDRSSFRIIQTPQCFSSEVLKEAYKTGFQNNFTDDASVVEFYGEKIHLVEGEQQNIKITYPVDLLIGEAILKEYFPEK